MVAKKKKLGENELALINGEFDKFMVDEKGKVRTIPEAIRDITIKLVDIHDKAKISLAEMLHEIVAPRPAAGLRRTRGLLPLQVADKGDQFVQALGCERFQLADNLL